MRAPVVDAAGETAYLISLGTEIDEDINRRVHAIAHAVGLQLAGFPRIEIVPAYAAVLVSFDPTAMEARTVEAAIDSALTKEASLRARVERRRFTLPVLYGGPHGPDIEYVAQLHGIGTDDVVSLHSDRDYPVFCLGFSPGFPFLGGLPASLVTPRLDTPRQRVPPGSVAIGGSQTGVYPMATPGGWRLIGRTPSVLFEPHRIPPVPYDPGDVIRFRSVSQAEFDDLSRTSHVPTGEPLST